MLNLNLNSEGTRFRFRVWVRFRVRVWFRCRFRAGKQVWVGVEPSWQAQLRRWARSSLGCSTWGPGVGHGDGGDGYIGLLVKEWEYSTMAALPFAVRLLGGGGDEGHIDTAPDGRPAANLVGLSVNSADSPPNPHKPDMHIASLQLKMKTQHGSVLAWPAMLLVAVGLGIVSAQPRYSPDTYPNPMVDTYKCGRKGVSSWVCDPDGILTYESANVVEGVIKKIFEGETPYVRTYCGASGQIGYQVREVATVSRNFSRDLTRATAWTVFCAMQVAVALMRQMRTTGDPAEYAETFARSLHDRWGVGSSECNNGVLFFLSLNDRQLYISTGAGAKHALSFDVLGDIISDIRPVLREGRCVRAISLSSSQPSDVHRGVGIEIRVGRVVAGKAWGFPVAALAYTPTPPPRGPCAPLNYSTPSNPLSCQLTYRTTPAVSNSTQQVRRCRGARCGQHWAGAGGAARGAGRQR